MVIGSKGVSVPQRLITGRTRFDHIRASGTSSYTWIVPKMHAARLQLVVIGTDVQGLRVIAT